MPDARETWCGFQERIASWEGGVLPPHKNTPQDRLHRGMEEVEELQEAVVLFDGTPEAKANVQEEATDVIIRMIGLVISTGGNVADLIDKKIQTIEQKYPVVPLQQQMRAGVPYEVAMARAKQSWQQRSNGQRQQRMT